MPCDLINNSKTVLLYTKSCHCTGTSVVVLPWWLLVMGVTLASS